MIKKATSELVGTTFLLATIVGSGITAANLVHFSTAHGFIVGSSVKQGGVWCNPLDRENVKAVATAFAGLSRDR